MSKQQADTDHSIDKKSSLTTNSENEKPENTKSKKTHRGRRKSSKQTTELTELGNKNDTAKCSHIGQGSEPLDEKDLPQTNKTKQSNMTNKTNSNDANNKQTNSDKNLKDKSLKTKRNYQRKPTIADSLNTKGPNRPLYKFFEDLEDTDDDMDDCIEYKIRPRSVFLPNACNLCKKVETHADKLKPCMHCGMVSYCCDNHRKLDLRHNELCSVICDEREGRGKYY